MSRSTVQAAARRAVALGAGILVVALAFGSGPAGALAASAGAAGPGGFVALPHVGLPAAKVPGFAGANMTYNGGPVMRTNTTYAIYWLPSGASFDANYETDVNRYFADVAHDSGSLSDVYAVATQYYDTTGPIAYQSSFGGSWVDTSAIPNDCSGEYQAYGLTVSQCVTDADVQGEVERAISVNGWSASSTAEFFVFTPRNVGSCVDSSSGECAYTPNGYCAYHFFTASGVIYANEPYPDASGIGGQDCEATGQPHPNGDWADAVINTVSHEHNEAITDPYENAWYDATGAEGEIGDKCAWIFGTSLGSTAFGAYNQLINGDHYYVQQEWSNLSSSCVSHMMTLGNSGNTVSANEGGPPVAADPALTVNDPGSTTLSGATVTVSAGSSSGDTLAATTGGTSIVASYTNGTLTLSGSDTVAHYQSVLRSVSFSSTSATNGTRTLSWAAGDGNAVSAPVTSGVQYAALPGAPTGVSAVAGNAQATVSFSAPGSNGGSAITSYTATASPGGAHASGSGGAIVVTGLSNGTAYTFTVTATNGVGTGPASAASTAVTPSAPAVPGAPTGVSAVTGDGQATVSFSAPGSNGGSAITGYTVTASPGGAHASGSGSPLTVSGLSNGTAYTFTVTATNGVGTGPASAASTAVTPSAAAVPGAPTGVSAVTGDGQATVSFSAPGSNGGSAITGYTVTASPGGAHASGSGSPLTVSGLSNGTAYTFTVTATNGVGTGPASAASTAVTPSAPSGGGGGSSGGGGGGGGGGGPDLHVAVSYGPQPRVVGDQFVYEVSIVNQGGNADASTLTVTLPGQVSLVSAKVDRGPGCVQSGQTLSCFLDFMSAGQIATEYFTVQVASLGSLVFSTSTSSSPGDANPSDSTVSSTIQVGAPAAPTTAPAPYTPPAVPAAKPLLKLPSLTVSKLATVLLDGKQPRLRLTTKLSGATGLVLVLADKRGKTVARWTLKLKAGSSTLSLLLPLNARHAGQDKLRITQTGTNKATTLPVNLRV